ncbi:MAG: hypothetical protein OEZ65_12060 [Gemmatimonadota bacterium]|nr:hypothetical protein [Gemmatimonadota bacterium]MDH5760315.1 hypothetical protein [Gemmatimonadota bacterium]
MNRRIILMAVVAAVACDGPSPAPGTSELGAQQPNHADPHAGMAAVQSAPENRGVVLETMDAGGYTYARLSMVDGEIWAAGPVTALAVGDTVGLVGPMPMGRFTSTSLDRTFEDITFVGRFTTASAPLPQNRGRVIQAMDAGGYTYVEVETEAGTLWLAAPLTQVAEGDAVAWLDGNVMTDFTSRTLERTFPTILFVGGITVLE